MRLGLQARFIAVLMLAALIAIAALVVIRSEQNTRDAAVASIVKSALQSADAPQQSNVLATIDEADHRFRLELALTLVALGLLLAAGALLVSRGLVQPIRRLAGAVEKIEDGEENLASVDLEREDEIGDLARAFATIGDSLAALRRRMDHDAQGTGAVESNMPLADPSYSTAHEPVDQDQESQGHTSQDQVLQPQVLQGQISQEHGPQKPVPQKPVVQDPPPIQRAANPAPPSSTMVMSPPARPPVQLPTPTIASSPQLAPEPSRNAAESELAVARRGRLEDDLREAWQRGEMRVLYQPIHAVANGVMRGAEALLRWQHPVEGAISPDEFIPLAERSNLIDTLGRYVLIQACSDAGLWPSGGTLETTPFLSVNVSPKQLQGPQLFEAVVEALRKSGLAAARLHLEIPVAALRSDDLEIAATIEQLRGLGVRIWIDAVGADATDQARWMKMSVDGVKVGRSRIAGRTDDPDDLAATDSIVATARALRVVAVVVGIEGLSQLDVLREQGADLAQGFVLCKPVGTAEIGRRLLA